MPVLLDGGGVREAHVILRYLAARQGLVAVSRGAGGARARVEAWMDWVAYDMTMPMRGAYLGGELGLETLRDHPWCVEQGRAEYTRRMTQLDAALAAERPHLAGEAFTLADIPAGFVVHRWFAMQGFYKPALPALDAYYERLSARPALSPEHPQRVGVRLSRRREISAASTWPETCSR